MVIVVAGGTGFVGQQLVRYLKRCRVGREVVVISRHAPVGGGTDSMSWHTLATSGLPPATRAVVNVCGQNAFDPRKRWTESFRQEVIRSRVGTSRALAASIAKAAHKPEVFVAISGVGCYAPERGGDRDAAAGHDESSMDFDDLDFMARLVQQWEAAARLPPELNVRNVWIRAGVALGRRGGIVKQLLPPFLLGLGGRLGSGDQHMPWIHVKDLARLIIHAIETPAVEGVLNGVSPEVVTSRELTRAFAAQLRRPALIAVPHALIKRIFGEERAGLITKGQKVIPKKTIASGFEFFYPTIGEACDECARFMYEDPDDQVGSTLDDHDPEVDPEKSRQTREKYQNIDDDYIAWRSKDKKF